MQANVKPTQSQREVVTPEEPESNWSRLIKGIVRPPRANYRDMQLGSEDII